MPDPLVFTVSKADPVGREPTAGAVLNITGELPHVRETLPTTGETIPHRVFRARCLNRHIEDAQQVVAALLHLPQGTVDQVLVLLLQQKASLLRVRVGPLPADLPVEPVDKANPAAPTAQIVDLMGALKAGLALRPIHPQEAAERALDEQHHPGRKGGA